MKNGLLLFLVGVGLAAFGLSGIGRACEYNKCLSTAVGTLVSDDIPGAGEIHAFSIPITAGDVLLIRANRTSGGIDPKISLLHPSGYIIATAGEAETGRAEMLSPRLTLTDSYTILVSDVTGGGIGSFNLAVQSVARPVNAVTVYYDAYRRDSLRLFSQMNAYRFQGAAGDVISVEMIAIAPPLTPALRLFGPDGRPVGTGAGADFALISNVGLRSTGQYVIIATDDLGDETGEYFLVLLRSTTDVADNDPAVPADFSMEQNHPNPFNPRTTVAFSLPRSAMVTIDIFNVLGESVRTLTSQNMPPGRHEIIWDGRNDDGREVPSGVYFYRLRAGDFSATKKMMLLR